MPTTNPIGTLAAPAQIAHASERQITVALDPADQAALDALHPSAYQLCASAQHALGLAALGSQIDSVHTTARVRTGDGLLTFADEAALWWVANTPPAVLRATIDRLLGEITERSATP